MKCLQTTDMKFRHYLSQSNFLPCWKVQICIFVSCCAAVENYIIISMQLFIRLVAKAFVNVTVVRVKVQLLVAVWMLLCSHVQKADF